MLFTTTFYTVLVVKNSVPWLDSDPRPLYKLPQLSPLHPPTYTNRACQFTAPLHCWADAHTSDFWLYNLFLIVHKVQTDSIPYIVPTPMLMLGSLS